MTSEHFYMLNKPIISNRLLQCTETAQHDFQVSDPVDKETALQPSKHHHAEIKRKIGGAHDDRLSLGFLKKLHQPGCDPDLRCTILDRFVIIIFLIDYGQSI
jgi:hypothetical protein